MNGSLQILLAAPATAESKRTLDDARHEAGETVPVETVLLAGVDAGELLRVASAGLDVLVMGSRGYGPTRRVLLGSVSAEVVHASACPVIVVPRGARLLVGAAATP
jgi:nucleotide-binding universal stress UspA family protein